MENDDQFIEYQQVTQDEKDIRKRKFINGNDDLIVWYDTAGPIVGFQLTIGETVITDSYGQFSVSSIDSSEKDNYSQILVGSLNINLKTVIDYIDKHGSMIGSEIIEFIKTAILKNIK